MSGEENLPGASHELLTFAALAAAAARIATTRTAAAAFWATILVENGIDGGPLNLGGMSTRVGGRSLRGGGGEGLGLWIHVGGSGLASAAGW